MQTLARLFGRSPFAPLQAHMTKVAACVDEIPALFGFLEKGDYEKVMALCEKISRLEHEADLTRNNIRNDLPTTLLLPVARENVLEMLSLQDDIADKAEDIAVLLSLRDLKIDPLISQDFHLFLAKNIETFHEAHKIIQELSELLESSFGGTEAAKVKKMVESVAFKEHESDVLQQKLLQIFFRKLDALPFPEFFLWLKVVQEIGRLSDISEALANRVRMTLEVR